MLRGKVRYNDITEVLRSQTYFGSYNIPYVNLSFSPRLRTVFLLSRDVDTLDTLTERLCHCVALTRGMCYVFICILCDIYEQDGIGMRSYHYQKACLPNCCVDEYVTLVHPSHSVLILLVWRLDNMGENVNK